MSILSPVPDPFIKEHEIIRTSTSIVPNISNHEFVCLHQRFEQQVLLTPNNVALVFRDKSLTFSQLNQKANNLAAFLVRSYQIMPDDIISIMLDRSEKIIIAILAILKTGAAYLPIDPDAPAERKAFICSDAEIKIVLTDNLPADQSIFSEIDFIDMNNEEIFTGNGSNITTITNPRNIAYVIFTSGSTGNPKGVLIEHRSVINFVNDNVERYKIKESDKFLLVTSYFFDVSVWEIFTPLLTGGCLNILEPGYQKYPEKILDACEMGRVNLLFLTPVVLQLLLSHLEANPTEICKLNSLRRLFAGGEVLTVKNANTFNKLIYRRLRVGLTNIYGPTEATVWVSVFDCESEIDLDIVPIGKAIRNTYIYTLDKNGDMVPKGETGELVIGGVPVGRGYINQLTLNHEKFVNNPFRDGEKMYKTGDRARYLPDGNIEFLGRMDNQIKLNGYRIEPGEIEKHFIRNPAIKECIVMATNIGEVKELVAYYTLTNKGLEDPPKENDLIVELKNSLSDFMIPSFFVQLQVFPINSNGKIDRKNLPLPTTRSAQINANFVTPSTDTERTIVKLIVDELKIASIGIDDNIFELGVQSLMVTKIMLKLNSVLGTDLTLPLFFQLPTVKELADYVDHNHKEIKNPFVLLKQGQGNALFLFPGQHGTPLTFLNFINNYTGSQPIYSISYPDEDTFSRFKDIQDFAGYLSRQIILIQPSGSYNFIGFSFGGNIAFEMALQLQQKGYKIDLLAIVSADAPLKKISLLNHKVLRELGFLSQPNFYLIRKYLKYRIPFLIKKSAHKPNLASSSSDTLDDFPKSNTARLWETYQNSQKYKGEIVLLYEELIQSDAEDFESIDIYTTSVMAKLWDKHVDGKIYKHPFKCKHGDFFNEPLVKDVASIIESHFENSKVKFA